MDAIPSLVAGTASCGAAAIGFAFGRARSSTREYETDGTNDDTFDPSTPLANRTTSSAPPSRFYKSSTLRRPQSASVPRGLPWGVSRKPTLEEHTGVASGNEKAHTTIPEQGSDHISGEELEERLDKPSWMRRVSTIGQSRDGSTLSTPRPSTPSLFSNGSNVPFLGSDPQVTSRNRLVKRSTSHRVLHSGNYTGSSFSASTTPMFRRPATSHQRSEQLKLQHIQRELESPYWDKTLSEEPKRDVGVPPAASSSDTTSVCHWQHHFRARTIRITSDTPRRASSVPRLPTISKASGPRSSDYIRCVEPSSGQTPSLIKSSDLKPRQPNPSTEDHNIAYSSTSQHPSQIYHSPRAETPSAKLPSGQVVKPRNSFSFSDIMPTPSPPWKSRGGSLRRKKGRETMNTSRRVASAPHKVLADIQGSTDQLGDTLESEDRLNDASSHRKENHRSPSSPLPSLNRLSPFALELPGGVSIRASSPLPDQLTTSPPHAASDDLESTSRDFPTYSRTFRKARIPSDRESTVLSSDNEHNKVFSSDGDEDYRSETIFDSIRTDATGNVHTGGKGYHIETVFRDPSSTELAEQNLKPSQEKHDRASFTSGEDFFVEAREDRSIEDDDSSCTPVQARSIKSKTASPKRQAPSSSLDVPSSPPTISTPTQPIDPYPQSIDFDDDWSGDEGDDESEDSNAHFAKLPGHFNGGGHDPSKSSQRYDLPERPKSNIFDWSDRPNIDKEPNAGSSPRPRTSHVKQNHDRGSRSTSRRAPSAFHLRSQSVPIPAEKTNHRFNNALKLDTWKLGGKGVSEDWDDDFNFGDDGIDGNTDGDLGGIRQSTEKSGVLVPPSIIEKQASVHGQFGQVKELTLLVEELRRLRHLGMAHGILHGQASGLWKEAEGIIDLASLEEEGDFLPPNSPTSASFDFDAFDDESPSQSRRRRSSASPQVDATNDGPTSSRPSPAGSRFDTPNGRPRKESIAKAKNVLENIHQHRSMLESIPNPQSSPKKLPFDTTSLRDLVTRAGVVTRALKEIIRRIENPDSAPQTPERRPNTPPDPPFSQIFYQQSSPSSKRSPRVVRRKSSSSFLGTPKSSNDNEINGHMKIMTVV